MKVAVTHKNGQIFRQFGYTRQFKVYTVENNKIVDTMVVDVNGRGHSVLISVLESLGVDVLVCGRIDGRVQVALSEVGISIYGGISGSCDAIVEALIASNLHRKQD